MAWVGSSQRWDVIIKKLEIFFKNTDLSVSPVKLNECSTITNCSLFVESHLAAVKHHKGNDKFLPYLKRLIQLRQKFIDRVE